MSKYQNGKIYAIRSYDTDEIYIGSTIMTLSRRMCKHRSGMKYWKEGKGNYTSSFKILEYPTCYIELLEQYPCNNRDELNKKEGEYIRSMNCVNKKIAGRTDAEWSKQYRLDNIEKIKEYQKEYRLDNKEYMRLCRIKYRNDPVNIERLNKKHPCECGGQYSIKHKSDHMNTKRHTEFVNKK